MIGGYATLERQAAAISRQVHLLREHARAPVTSTAVQLATELGIRLDPWQQAAVSTNAQDILLLAARQSGKSTVAAILALHEIIYSPGSLVLVISPSERQSKRLLRVVRRHYGAMQGVMPATSEGQLVLELRNGSEIHALPGKEATVRGFAQVDLLIIDEAARVDDDLYASVRPMLAVSNGRLVALSTPFGRRGWFYREYAEGGPEFHRTKVSAYDVPRIAPAWLERERNRIGDWWFRQEFLCEWLDAESAAFASDDVARAFKQDVQLWIL